MATSGEDRARRAEARRRRRGQDSASQQGGRPPEGEASAGADTPKSEVAGVDTDEDSPLRTAAKIAAAAVLVGGAVVAARAARSRAGEDAGTDDDGEGKSRPTAASDDEPGARPEAEAESPPAAEAEDQPDPPADPEEEPLSEPRAEEQPRPAAEPEEDPRMSEESDEPADASPADGHERDEEQPNEEDDQESARTEAAANGRGAGRILRRAREQLAELTGRPPEGVLGFERTEDGWRVEIEMVELSRIPSTTDVLGAYDVEVDDDGDIQNYHRTRRYVRGQAGESGQA